MQNDLEFIDAFKEFLNIGVGRATSVLGEMLQLPISLTVPAIEMYNKLELVNSGQEFINEELSTVQMEFSGKFSGKAGLVLPTQSARNLVTILMGGDDEENMNEFLGVTINEVGNIILNGLLGSISNMLKEHLDYSVPVYNEDTVKNLLNKSNIDNDSTVVLGKAKFSVNELDIQGDVLLLLNSSQYKEFNRLINSAE